MGDRKRRGISLDSGQKEPTKDQKDRDKHNRNLSLSGTAECLQFEGRPVRETSLRKHVTYSQAWTDLTLIGILSGKIESFWSDVLLCESYVCYS